MAGRNEAYVNERLRMMGVKRLTTEEKKEFDEKIRIYQNEKLALNDLRKQISEIEAKLEKKLPSILEAEYIHDSDIGGCGFKTVLKLEKNTGGEDLYYCVYCDKHFQLDPDDLRYSGVQSAI
ncbi:MAG: hypothetical protein ABIH65_00390 [Nanoarchaeota archaeon]